MESICDKDKFSGLSISRIRAEPYIIISKNMVWFSIGVGRGGGGGGGGGQGGPGPPII